MISVVIPVGPYPANRRWLQESLDSVRAQTYKADEILIIDDMAFLEQEEVGDDVRIWKCPWNVGVACADNFGVALAKNNLVVLFTSDDWLYPWCLQNCIDTYQKYQDELGYYWFDIEYSDGRIQRCASGPAMVTKALWKHTGGLPPEASSGASDALFNSILIAHHGEAGRQYQIISEEPPYWFRMHDECGNAYRGPWQGVILETRKLCSDLWKSPEWTKKIKEGDGVSVSGSTDNHI